ncbi:uroporphyrinogen decarboxylase [Rickettsiales bacterium]|nr:uroporphyrinogen decarboxylase [Rickettsiales bacterium]
MKKLLETLKGKNFKTPPIWLMRQAGRYLPEYREIRKEASNFLELCYNPKLASEITLQPIRRFGFDGAIIFSDILVIPDALGVDVNFVKNIGPQLSKTLKDSDLIKFKEDNILKHLKPVFENIKLVKDGLDDDKTLIGFSGSPWTIATYMIEGGSSKKFDDIRRIAIKDKDFFQKLIDILVNSISIYLIEQIKSGVDVVKIFDSWAGILPESEFKKWVIEPNKKIIQNIKKIYPNIPIILFTKGAGTMYEEVAVNTDCDALAIDQCVSKKWAKDILQNKHNKIIQGNLDNITLTLDVDYALNEVKNILDHFNDKPFIFNLGHGILPDTPIDNVEKIINFIKNYQ